MDLPAVHPLLLTVEIALLATGATLLLRAIFVPARRRRWFETNRLVHWPISGPEVALLILAMLGGGMVLQGVTRQLLEGWLVSPAGAAPLAGAKPAPGMTGQQLFAYGLSFQLGALAGWAVFPRLRRIWQPEVGGPPRNVDVPAYRLPLSKVAVAALSAVLVAIPVLALTALVWTRVLEVAGLPAEPQDLIGIFARTDSALVFAGLLIVACVMAPVTEELMFRRCIYRFLRQRFGRALALVVSASLFGALHANWASFAPLCVLGVIFAIAYENSGDLRVPVVAHGLFNLLNAGFIVVTGGPT